jgi:hypothetical protein
VLLDFRLVAFRSPQLYCVRAIEATDPVWFCGGVQWRPETDAPAAPDLRLFAGLTDVCRRRTQPRTVAA